MLLYFRELCQTGPIGLPKEGICTQLKILWKLCPSVTESNIRHTKMSLKLENTLQRPHPRYRIKQYLWYVISLILIFTNRVEVSNNPLHCNWLLVYESAFLNMSPTIRICWIDFQIRISHHCYYIWKQIYSKNLITTYMTKPPQNN